MTLGRVGLWEQLESLVGEAEEEGWGVGECHSSPTGAQGHCRNSRKGGTLKRPRGSGPHLGLRKLWVLEGGEPSVVKECWGSSCVSVSIDSSPAGQAGQNHAERAGQTWEPG